MHSRARLIKHLSETRMRAKNRTVLCRDAFLASGPNRVSTEKLATLEAKEAAERRECRKRGHSNIISERPAKVTKPHILKRSAPEAHPEVLADRERLRTKKIPHSH